MAKSAAKSGDGGDSSGSWPGLFAYLNKTFDLVRDIFGYALPGGVFFAIGVASGHLSLAAVHEKLCPYEPPTWALVALAGAGCYAMGHILIMLAYLPTDLMKLGLVVLDWRKPDSWPKDWLQAFPTEVTREGVMVRRKHPDFFFVLDRRETMAMAIAGLGAALLLGGLYFYCYWGCISLCHLLLWVGALLLFDFITALLHLYRVRKAIFEADALTGTELAPGEYERAMLDLLNTIAKAAAAPPPGPGAGKNA